MIPMVDTGLFLARHSQPGTKMRHQQKAEKSILRSQLPMAILVWPNYNISPTQISLKGISLTKPPFGVISCEVAII